MSLHPPRPTFEEIAASIAEPVVRDWFEDFVRHRPVSWLKQAVAIIDGHDRQELSRLLVSVFRACVAADVVDGYHAAKLFETTLNQTPCKPWPVDARVVSALQTAIDMTLDKALANAERRWVLETGERVGARVGDRVEFHLNPGDFDVFVGTVSAIDPGRARLTVTGPGKPREIVAEAVITVDRRRVA